LLERERILLLDEAGSALDGENQLAVAEGLRALHGRATLLVITHQLSTIEHADQILVVDDHSIAEHGTHAQLLAAGGRYADFWRARAASEGRRLNASHGDSTYDSSSDESVSASPTQFCCE
jgi:ATP-binding cassette, subfamily B, bacterial IrtB/YbtQ